MTTRPLHALVVRLGIAAAIFGAAAATPAQSISIEGIGYTLSVNETGRVAVLELSSTDYRRATVEGLSESRIRTLSKRLYNHFDDVFDFLIFMNDTDDVVDSFPYRGATHIANNEVRGIGLSRTNRSSLFGSDGQLQSAVHLATDDGLASGAALRELVRRWANALLPTEVESYWGYSNAGGQLGGWSDGTLTWNQNTGAYSASGPGGAGWTPDGQNLDNNTPYSLIELYAMGLMPPSGVPPLLVARNPVPGSGGTFTASGFDTWDIERIESRNGERLPTSGDAQRTFRAALIVLAESGNFPTPQQLNSYDSQVAAFSDDGATFPNSTFTAATRGIATLRMDGLREFFTGPADLAVVSIEIDPPQLHVRLRANNGARYQVEHSPDLENWFEIGPPRTGLGSPERVTLLGIYSPTTPIFLRMRELR